MTRNNILPDMNRNVTDMVRQDMKNETKIFSPTVFQWEKRVEVGFCDLANAVRQVHLCSNHAAVKAINHYATMRNWLIGFFIVEYQQKGNDRAAYGEKLLKRHYKREG